MRQKAVVVTGASTGIGHGIAQVLAEHGFHVFGTVRKEEDGRHLAAELGTACTPLLMDVTDEAMIQRCADEVGRAIGGGRLAGLVNNAGISHAGPLLHQPISLVRRQLEVNLVSPLLVVRHFAPLLGTDPARTGAPGRVVNISSVGGRIGVPFLGAYAASKHGLEGMSESLRRELMLFGIDVILIEPGYVNTPILDKAEVGDYDIYGRTAYKESLAAFVKIFLAGGRRGLAPRAIGEVVRSALCASSPKTCYTVIQGRLTNWTIPMALPKRLIDRVMGRQFGLMPR